MANEKMKKAVAMTLAMAMCWSTLSVQAFAAEVNEQAANSGAAESAIVASVNGDTTVTGAGTAESPKLTVTVTTEKDGSTTTTTTTSEWNGQTPLPKEESVPSEGEGAGESQTPSDDQKSEATTTTTVTGSETKVETETVDSKDRVTKETGHVEGSETTQTETTKTEVKKDQVIDEKVDKGNSSKETVGETSDYQWEDDKDQDENNWDEGDTAFGEWTSVTENVTEGAGKDGWKTTTEETDPVTSGVKIPDPLDDKDVVLNLTPGTANGPTTVEKEETVTTETILLENSSMFDLELMEKLKDAGGKIETKDGDKTIVKEAIYGKNGAVIGYTVTTITTTTTPGTTGEVQTTETREAETGYETKTSAPEIPETWADELKTVGKVTETTDGEKVTKTATSEKGVKVEMTKAPIYKTNDAGIPEVDAEGNKIIIGYTITKKTTTPGGGTVTSKATGETTTENAPTETRFELPAKPAESKKTENGVTTKVVVEDVYDGDKHVGYKTITTKTKNGKVIYTGAETIYGTTTTVNKTTVTDPTTKKVTTDTTTVTTEVTTIYGYTQTSDVNVTQTQTTTGIKTTEVTETEAYQLVETDEGTFFLYKGQMYAVLATGDHGDVTVTSLKPNVNVYEPGTTDGTVNSATDMRNPENFTTDKELKDGYDFQYVGYGLETAITVNQNHETNPTNTLAHQFKLVDEEGNEFYVLCADLGINAVRGESYNMVNVNSANYYQRDGAAAKIEAIALSGFWGTDSGIGSLQNVKALLKQYNDTLPQESQLTEDEINALTPGQALTATQAAIWYYGNSNASKNMHDSAVTGKVYTGGSSQTKASREEARAVNALYQVLIGLDPESVENNTTTLITEQNFAQKAAIIIKDKTDAYVNNDTDTDNDQYNTDIQFTLAVTPGANDTLIVQVIQNGEVVATKRLAGDDSTTNYGTIQAEKGVYTIPGIRLTENVEITLNLDGVQQLNQGVYLYSAAVYSTSQTFVGVASGEREVNLNVNMSFEVEEPTASQQVTKDKTTKTTTEKETETRTGSRVDTREGITEKTDTTTTTTGTKTTVVYADVTVTEVTNTETNREWTEDWEETFTYPSNNKPDPIIPDNTPTDPVDPVIPDEPTPETPVDPEIPEEPTPETPVEPEAPVEIPEEVPLADVPQTGDISALWYGLTLLSGGGLLGLLTGRKGKEEQ